MYAHDTTSLSPERTPSTSTACGYANKKKKSNLSIKKPK